MATTRRLALVFGILPSPPGNHALRIVGTVVGVVVVGLPYAVHRVASLSSGLWWDDRPIYSYAAGKGASRDAWVVVEDDGCYRFYGGDEAG